MDPLWNFEKGQKTGAAAFEENHEKSAAFRLRRLPGSGRSFLQSVAGCPARRTRKLPAKRGCRACRAPAYPLTFPSLLLYDKLEFFHGEEYKMRIRNEAPRDREAVEALTRRAFYNLYIPGCVEHYLVHIMREHEDFIPELDFVLEKDGRIIGNIIYTKAQLVNEAGREKEILVAVARGLTNKQIAEKLCLSTHTVITHRRNIAAKLQIHSAAGLTIYAIVNRFVDLNDVKGSIHRKEE